MKFTDGGKLNQSKLINVHAGHRKRLRGNLVENQWEGFDEHQMLEYILQQPNKQKDTNPIAHRLISEFGSFANVLDASVEDLKKIDGVGEVTATFLHSIPNLFKAYKKSKQTEKPTLTCPREVYDYLGKTFNHMPIEEFYVIYVDGNSKLIVSKLLAKGTNNEVAFSLKMITETAVRTQAQGVIILHNHPNGEPKPSSEDIDMTRKIYYNLMLNNIYLVDHLIITKDEKDYYSFANNKILENFGKDYVKLVGQKLEIKNAQPPYCADKI